MIEVCYFSSCGRDKVVILWDLVQNKQLRTLPTYEVLEGMVLLPKAPCQDNIPLPLSDSVLVAVAGEKGKNQYLYSGVQCDFF